KPHDPKMIGLWKVGRTLGKGFSGHYAAIKIISKGSLSSRVSLNRLADEVEHNLLAVEREIVVMKLIDHPNIMKLYDSVSDLEYVQGGELFDYLCDQALKTSCGSPHYAAPEIISGRPYDGAMSDIWSCGIILYALLAAKLPFDDDDCPTLLRKISIGHFDMPEDISPQAQDLISRMLTIDVKRRITMPEIMRHPFLNPTSEKSISASYGEEDDLESTLERKKGRHLRRKLRPSESMLPPLITMTSEMSLVHVHYPTYDTPGISLSAPSPEMEAMPADALSSLVVPELEDEKMHMFFQQVANHLNILQARTGSISKAGGQPGTSPSSTSSSSKDPPKLHVDIPSPIKLRYHGFNGTNGNISSTPSSPLDEFGLQDTKPLTLRGKGRSPLDKENRLPITESIIHRHSPLTRQTARLTDNTRLQIDTSLGRRPSKLKKKRVPTDPPVSPMFSEAGSSFTFSAPPGAQRRGWLDTVFKFKPATYSLMSRYDVHTTRSECRRLLMEMDMLVALEDAEKLGILKCRTHDVNSGSNGILGLKTVKFRVELQWPPPLLCREGYIVALVVMERTWTLDDGSYSRPSSVASSTPSSINAANYLGRQR
ncbi:kinase-like domain-containing protein, partial [Pholiota molesta]